MSLTDREAALDVRARYIRLIAALRTTRDHNPETLEAFETILRPEAVDPFPPRRVNVSLSTITVLSDLRRVAA
jgi:hypothetical protein